MWHNSCDEFKNVINEFFVNDDNEFRKKKDEKNEIRKIIFCLFSKLSQIQ